MDPLLYTYDSYMIHICIDEFTIHGLFGEVTSDILSLGKSPIVEISCTTKR